ncbi:PH domain-containing protein [Meloidogyne graminicola]|uniref:PH domain-containing protein n=1 Tax=Meloidogyne graminicola TaxID=189291 RepID=A0A8T0A0H3_9BILA|nr:PH domain-containing protein [Meloidogyne graminicola]
MSLNPNSIIKEGFVQRYKSGFLSNKWKSNYAILYSDSTLAFYNERGNPRPAETVFIRNVVPYTCVGFMCDRMPVRRPSLPSGVSVQRLVGIGLDPQASKVYWILFPSEQILEEWMNAILSTLPKPPSSNNQNIPQQPASGGIPSFVPPTKYPDAPPPPYGQNYPSNNTQQTQQTYYPPPQQPQTVIIDRTTTAYTQ